MATSAADKAARDARLDQLVSLTQQWSQKTQKMYNDRVDSLKRILQGRNAGQLLDAQQKAVSALTVTEISNFLSG